MDVLNEIVRHYYEMHSLIPPAPRNGKAGWYETFRNHAYLAVDTQNHRVFLIGDAIIANFSKLSSIFDEHFSKFNTLNCGIGGDKIQYELCLITGLFHLPYSISLLTVVQIKQHWA